ncbi:MAG: hypothetical protein HY429_01880 [Candidatus Levybacteria bacterium]|nr:hypothetical protein [Candidatus Levybacteria bacterium]
MDNSAQKTQNTSLATPAPAPLQQPSPPQVAQTPISGVQKEHEVLGAPLQSSETLLTPVETKPALSPEVEKAGVEVPLEHEPPQIPHEAQEAGLAHAKESAPLPTTPSETLVLPMDPKQAHIILKTHKKISDSIVWLAMLVLRQVKMMHEKVIGRDENAGN